MLAVTAHDNEVTLVLDAYLNTMQNVGERMAVAFKHDMKPLANEAVETMSDEPPVWRKKRRWNSERQRKAVMAKLRREGSLPYTRTHLLAESWRSYLEADARGGVFRIGSNSDKAQFVQGANAQLMHLDSNWPQLDRTTTELRPRAIERATETWYTVSIPHTATASR